MVSVLLMFYGGIAAAILFYSLRTEGIERVINLYNKGIRFHKNLLEKIQHLKKNVCLPKMNSELIKDLGNNQLKDTVSFDLSYIGIMISDEATFTNLEELAKEAQKYNIQLMISMEESQKTDKFFQYIKGYQNHSQMLG